MRVWPWALTLVLGTMAVVVLTAEDPTKQIEDNLEEGWLMLTEIHKIQGRTAGSMGLLEEPIEMKASWYGEGDRLNEKTSSGERFNSRDMTCAHREWPMNSIIMIVAKDTGRRVFLRINDRGPAEWTGRDIDITERAARLLGVKEKGEFNVVVSKVKR